MESSPPLDAILDQIPSLDKTLTVAKQKTEKHSNNKLNTENQSMAKNVAETASHNFSTQDFPVVFLLRFLSSHMPLRSLSRFPYISCMKTTGDESDLNIDKLWSAIEKQIHKKLDDYLEDSWLKYLLHLVKVDDTGA